jgi:hypothetical protein
MGLVGDLSTKELASLAWMPMINYGGRNTEIAKGICDTPKKEKIWGKYQLTFRCQNI